MAVAALAATAPAAWADTYNIVIKNSTGTALGCASGGFTYTKPTSPPLTGTFAGVTASISYTADNCFSPVDLKDKQTSGSFSSSAMSVVIVQNADAGPTMAGMSGTMTDFNKDGKKKYEVVMGATGCGPSGCTRPLTVTQYKDCDKKDGCVAEKSFSGSYFIYNLASVPEPGTLALFALGLFGLVGWPILARRQRA